MGYRYIKEKHVKPIDVTYCYCRGCGYRQPAPQDRKCTDLKCPQCGTWMFKY